MCIVEDMGTTLLGGGGWKEAAGIAAGNSKGKCILIFKPFPSSKPCITLLQTTRA